MGTRTRTPQINLIGLSKNDYKGQPTSLCQGCGHNSIASQIVQVAYDLNIRPHEIVISSACHMDSTRYTAVCLLSAPAR